MSRQKTTENFINESKEIHGINTYDYTKTIYTGRFNPIIITCRIHGDFTINEAKAHLSKKQGCLACSRFNKWLVKSTKKFENEKVTFSSNFYGVSDKAIDDRVVITCIKHQVCFTMTPSNLLDIKRTCLCSLCLNEKKEEKKFIKIKKVEESDKGNSFRLPLEEVIRRVHATYGEYNDCSNLVYVNRCTLFNFTCTRHNKICVSSIKNISEEPDVLKCSGCRKDKKNSERVLERAEEKKKYIELSNIKYNNRYDYSKVEYITYSGKVIICCPLHGDFEQSFNSHLKRTWGCQKCGAENSCGYSKGDYIKKCNGRKARLYLVECFNEDEKFYKIGITVNNLSRRFRGSKMPYDVKLIKEFISEPDIVFDKEKVLLKECSEYSYTPKFKMEGSTECFLYKEEVVNIFINNI